MRRYFRQMKDEILFSLRLDKNKPSKSAALDKTKNTID